MAVKAVIFDLFGTLVCRTLPEKRIIEKWKLDPKIHDALERVVCGHKFKNWEEYLDKVIELIDIEKNQRNRAAVKKILSSSFEKGVKGVFLETRKVLEHLKKKGYQLGLVSNAYPCTRKILERNGLLKYFKKNAVIFSYEVGTIKQEGKIYGICLRRLGVPASETIMVGDNLKWDIFMARKATNGKIKGILISAKPNPDAKKAGCFSVSSLAIVPKAVAALSKPRARIGRVPRKPSRRIKRKTLRRA